MPTINNLNDAKCKSAKPAEKARKLFDGGGLYLFVSPAGSKTWRLAYRYEGKPKTIAFGPYPEISLAEARARRDSAKAILRDGRNPMAEKRPSAFKQLTLTVANSTYWSTRRDLSEKYRAMAERSIELHLGPRLGERPMRSVDRQMLLDALNVVDAQGRPKLVRRLRMWAEHLFDWAGEQGLAVENPAAQINPKKAFSRGKGGHYAALEQREVPDFMARLDLEGELNSVLACILLALTWTRTNELRRMKWEQIEEGFWRLPGVAMKKGEYHLVPLSRQALAIIEKMRLRHRGGPFVFPHEAYLDKPMSGNTILSLIYRMGYKGRMTGHGWRTVGSTWANELGYNRDAIERQLAHEPEDKTRAAYNRAMYLPERVKMMQDWGDWLVSLQPDACFFQG